MITDTHTLTHRITTIPLVHAPRVNENVQRGYTSERTYIDFRRPNRRTPLKVLVDKGFRFIDDVWSMYMKRNMHVTGYVHVPCIYIANTSSIPDLYVGMYPT